MSRATSNSGLNQQQRRHVILFTEAPNGYWGDGAGQRRWHITKTVTGWRLEFLDPGDASPTYAGVHSTLDRAKLEAAVVTGVRRAR